MCYKSDTYQRAINVFPFKAMMENKGRVTSKTKNKTWLSSDVSGSVDTCVQATSIFTDWKSNMWEESFSVIVSEQTDTQKNELWLQTKTSTQPTKQASYHFSTIPEIFWKVTLPTP